MVIWRRIEWTLWAVGMIVMLVAWLIVFSGCSGRPRLYALCGIGSPARHNVEPMVGAAAEWQSGAEIQLRYEPWLRIEEPSSRGFPREVGRVFAEAKIPLGGR